MNQIVQSKKTLHEILLSEKSVQSLNAVARGLMTGERLANILWQCVQKTPSLMRCNPATLISATKTLAQLGCEPDGIHGYLVPFKDACTPIPSARGLLRMAKSNGIANINIGIVRKGDPFTWNIIDGQFNMSHQSDWNESEQVIGYYITWEDKQGKLHGERMSKSAVDAIRERSRAKNSGPWVTDYDQMALKTVIKRASKQWDLPYEYQVGMAEADRQEFGDLPQQEMRKVTPKESTGLMASLPTGIEAEEMPLEEAPEAQEMMDLDIPEDELSFNYADMEK